MPTINNRYIYTDIHANDNRLVMTPMWDGLSFMGYAVVKGNWKCHDVIELWEV